LRPEPAAVPGFIRRRGGPPGKAPRGPGAGQPKAEGGPEQHRGLAQALADGRFPQLAEQLLLYRDIATMDPEAPLPELGPTPPDWRRAAAHASELGLGILAGRLESLA